MTDKLEWEYLRLTTDPRQNEMLRQDELNKAGDDGWELAAVITLPFVVEYIFKHPRF